MTNHLFRIAGLVCFLPSFAWSQASPRALEVAMTAGLYIAPEASDPQPRGTIAFRFLWGGKGRTHAFGIEAGYFGLGSSEFDAILPIYRVGTSAPPDTARVIERSSATMISILPTYSFRPQGLGFPVSLLLSAGLARTRTRILQQLEDLNGEILFDNIATRSAVNFVARIGLAAAIPGVLVGGAPEVGIHAYAVGTTLDLSPLLGVYVGFRF